jgi:hypothetical protein
MLIHISASRGHGEIAVAGADRDAVDRVTDDLIAALRDPEPHDDEVPFTFWAGTPAGPMNPRRRVSAPTWGEIRANYGAAARETLHGLMAATQPGAGRLLLWHGEPGTGKSYALRALARQWRAWCEMHFITDADAFLGGHTSYLLNALMTPSRGPAGEERWRLIVLEDAGELLAADARALAGQALSRLLNLSDGLLGSGMRTIVLVTTNEPLRRMHPAVVRPGRTWAQVEFTALTITDANRWLAERGIDARLERETPVADLFAAVRGDTAARPAPLGFAA